MKTLWGKLYFLGLSLLLVTFFTDRHISGRSGKKTVTSLPHAIPRPGARIGLPLCFEANRGQADPRVRFLCRRGQTALFLTDNEAIFIPNAANPASLRMKLRGANPHPQLRGVTAQSGRVNYFCGSDRRQWRTDIPLFARVRCGQVYPGVDLVYYGNGDRLEYDLVVAPGADPERIALEFTGARQARINSNGDLVLSIGDTPVRMHRPVIYQERQGRRQILAGGFQRRGRNCFGFQVAEYDHARPLIIDPEISFSTCLGGSEHDSGNSIAVDQDGNVYVTGYTASINFPTDSAGHIYNGAYRAFCGRCDAFIAKLNPKSRQICYCTYLGGSGDDYGYGIAVDTEGCAYITGYTQSSDFPYVQYYQKELRGTQDIFVAKVAPSKTGIDSLVFSSYLGGSGVDAGNGIAVGANGVIYLTGSTGSPVFDFPTVGNALPSSGSGTDAILVALQPDPLPNGKLTLRYSSRFGGSDNDNGNSVSVDIYGNAYFVGDTASTIGITPSITLFKKNTGVDAFFAKVSFDAQWKAIVTFFIYLGGSGGDYAFSVCADQNGMACVAGQTNSGKFPTVNSWQPTGVSNVDAFAAKFDTNAKTCVYCTYLGGNGTKDVAHAVAMDGDGNAYVVGETNSTTFNGVARPLGSTTTNPDAFLTVLDPSGAPLLASEYIGGKSNTDKGLGIALGGGGIVWLSGVTTVATGGTYDFPELNPLYPYAGKNDAFLVCLSPSPLPVTLAEWQARRRGNTVRLSWRIAEGADAIGFYLLRGPGPEGPFTRLNRRLLPADGERNAYQFADHAAFAGAYYCLEIITAAGACIRSAPIPCP